MKDKCPPERIGFLILLLAKRSPERIGVLSLQGD